jgi:hypothetical protein
LTTLYATNWLHVNQLLFKLHILIIKTVVRVESVQVLTHGPSLLCFQPICFATSGNGPGGKP